MAYKLEQSKAIKSLFCLLIAYMSAISVNNEYFTSNIKYLLHNWLKIMLLVFLTFSLIWLQVRNKLYKRGSVVEFMV